MGALARAYFVRGAARLPLSTVLIFWLAVAAGVLVKGPLVPMFAALAVLALFVRERSARWFLALRPGLGVLIVLALALPWFVAIAVKSGGAFFTESVGHDMLGKVGTAQTYHWQPPGFYLLAFFATFWPAAALAVLAIPFAWKNRSDDRIAFALAWIVPSWLVFELVPTKLPHYVMPLYPAIAIVDRAGAVARFRRAARPRLEADGAPDAVHPGRDRGRACLRGKDPRRAPALGRACRHASRHARCLRGLVALRPRRARRGGAPRRRGLADPRDRRVQPSPSR